MFQAGKFSKTLRLSLFFMVTSASCFTTRLAWLAPRLFAQAPAVGNTTGSPWPNEPAELLTISDQPWNQLTGDEWNYQRRTSSEDDRIITDATAPFSPPKALQIVFTPDMRHDSEP